MRYSPGSLVLVVCTVPSQRNAFVERVFENQNAVCSLDKVRGMLAGQVKAGELEARSTQVMEAAISKRLAAGEPVVVAMEGVGAAERERYVREAASHGRARHMILVEAPRDVVREEDRSTLNQLRCALEGGDLGAEGFQTAAHVGGAAIGELKRIVFRPPPPED
jgi:hypothetical protein